MTPDRGPGQDGGRSRVEVVALQLRATRAVEVNREHWRRRSATWMANPT